MKTETELKIYLLAQASSQMEWKSLLGDKFRYALPFAWSLTDRIQEAQVVVWDGLFNSKGLYYFQLAIDSLKEGKQVLLLQPEAYTLFRTHPFLKTLDISGIRCVEGPGGNILPEDLLTSIEQCREKLNNV